MLIKKIIAATLLLVLSSSLFASADWTNRYGNAARTRSLAIHTNPANYHDVWGEYFSPSMPGYYVAGSPIIVDHTLVLSLRTSGYDQARVIAFDVTNGDRIWSTDVRQIATDKIYQDGKVYISVYQGGHTEYIRSINAITGETLDEKPEVGDIETILADGLTAYLNVNKINLAGYNLDTGQITWMEKLSPGRHFGSIFSLSKDYLVSKTFDGFLVFNRRNGKEMYKTWVDNTLMDGIDEPAIINIDTNKAIALFTDDDLAKSGMKYNQATLVAINLDKGKVVWTLPKQNNHISPSLINNIIFCVDVGLSRMNAVDAESGLVRWSWQAPSDDKIIQNTKLAATLDVIFITTEKRVYAISQSTHKIVWQFDGDVDDIALGEGRLFMFSNGYNLDSMQFVEVVALS